MQILCLQVVQNTLNIPLQHIHIIFLAYDSYNDRKHENVAYGV